MVKKDAWRQCRRLSCFGIWHTAHVLPLRRASLPATSIHVQQQSAAPGLRLRHPYATWSAIHQGREQSQVNKDNNHFYQGLTIDKMFTAQAFCRVKATYHTITRNNPSGYESSQMFIGCLLDNHLPELSYKYQSVTIFITTLVTLKNVGLKHMNALPSRASLFLQVLIYCSSVQP